MRLKHIMLAGAAIGPLLLAGCATTHQTTATSQQTATLQAKTAVHADRAEGDTIPLDSTLRVFRRHNNLWAKAALPAPGPAHSYGTYNAGCITGAIALPLTGKGFQVMRPSHNRYYGHPDLVRFITDLGAQAHDDGISTILVGDMGQPRGGPTPSGHASHQVGLDVDIWLSQVAATETRPLSRTERESIPTTSFVAPNGRAVNSHWTHKQSDIIRLSALSPQVDRIFVNPAIKQELCREYPGAAWLHKVRPWWLHVEHEHVRLKHDPADTLFRAQPPVPEGNGCDQATFNWWFAQEDKARAETKLTPAEPPAEHPILLPAACGTVLRKD